MTSHRLIPIFLLLTTIHATDSNPYPTVGAIPLPSGYTRVPVATHSFASWLRTLPLKKDRTVYLYNGEPKHDQQSQFAVLDLSMNDPSIEPGSGGLNRDLRAPKDLQQCADAVMRLRAEYLYSQDDYTHIDFVNGAGVHYNFAQWMRARRDETDRRKVFGEFMETVFTYCGSLTLSRQLLPEGNETGKLQIGDVLIHGGSPGHAMLVVDMAGNRSGQKIYLLAQGYLPACSVHVVRNLYDGGLNPWYPVDGKTVYTPGYTFDGGQFRSWPEGSRPR